MGIEVWSVQTRPLDPDFRLPAEHEQRYTFRRLSLEDALHAASRPELRMSVDFVTSAFERDDLCMGAYDGDQLIAYVWRSLDLAPIQSRLWLKLVNPSCRYGYKSLVLPEYRGQRLNTSIGRFYDHNFVRQGIVYDVGYVSMHNLASMKSTFRDPERCRVGFAVVMVRGQRVHTWRSPGSRKYLDFEVAS